VNENLDHPERSAPVTHQKRVVVVIVSILAAAFMMPLNGQSLEGIAVLPADSFAEGPTSGQFITPANGRTPPFVNMQPIQGISSVLRVSNGDFLVMSDNGFGTKDNSPDYVLRVYRVSPDFKTANKGTGMMQVVS
jgi:hypothetical protein